MTGSLGEPGRIELGGLVACLLGCSSAQNSLTEFHLEVAMPSVHDIKCDPGLQSISRLAVFRCKREYPVHAENVRRLARGWTGWWEIDQRQRFDGVMVLIDAVRSKSVEAWAGLIDTTPGSREQRPSDGRWRLAVADGFRCVSVLDEGAVKTYLDKQPGNGVTYIDLKGELESGQTVPGQYRSKRGFNPEFSGDRASVPKPSGYTPRSTHGRIVTALYERLCSLGYADIDNKTGYWDLHGYCPHKKPTLFEVKTSADTTSVFCAIGQLLMYEQEIGPSRKFAVLPMSAAGSATLRVKLANLHIGLVTYEPDLESFRFKGL